MTISIVSSTIKLIEADVYFYLEHLNEKWTLAAIRGSRNTVHRFPCNPYQGDVVERAVEAMAAVCCLFKAASIAVDMLSFDTNLSNHAYLFNSLCDTLDNQAFSGKLIFVRKEVKHPLKYVPPTPHLSQRTILYDSRSFYQGCTYQSYNDFKKEFEEYEVAVNEVPFREYLRKLMEEKGYTNASDLYRAAGISKDVFSKIMNYKLKNYKPSKNTVAALAIGLRLNLDEALKFYHSAGYHLGENDFIDRVIRFFIDKKDYDIIDVNICLEEYGYGPLGERTRDVKIEY